MKGMEDVTSTFAIFFIFMGVATIFGIVVVVLHNVNVSATKELVVNIIYEPVSTQDALLSLFQVKNNKGITFNKALVYAVYESTLNPKIPQKDAGCNDNLCDYDLKAAAEGYMNYIYSGKKYKLFLYNPDTKEEKVIARNSKDDDFKLYPYGKRDSIPIKPENYWLVLYVK